MLQQASQSRPSLGDANNSSGTADTGEAADTVNSPTLFSNPDSSFGYYPSADRGSGSTLDANADLSSTSLESSTSFEVFVRITAVIRHLDDNQIDQRIVSRFARQRSASTDTTSTASTTDQPAATPDATFAASSTDESSSESATTVTHSDPEPADDPSPDYSAAPRIRPASSQPRGAQASGATESNDSTEATTSKPSTATSANTNAISKAGSGGAVNSGPTTNSQSGSTSSALSAQATALAAQPIVPASSVLPGRPGGRGNANSDAAVGDKSTTAATSEPNKAASSATDSVQSGSAFQSLTPDIFSAATTGQAAQLGAVSTPVVTKGKGSSASSPRQKAETAPLSQAATTAATTAPATSDSDSSATGSGPLGGGSMAGTRSNGPGHRAATQGGDPNIAAGVVAAASGAATPAGQSAVSLNVDSGITTKGVGPATADNAAGNAQTQIPNAPNAAAATAPTAPAANNNAAAAGQTATQPGSSGMSEVDRVRFVQRVARAFQAADQDGGQIRLRLSPPELGALKLDITLNKGSLTAHVETETSTARTMLLDNLPQLRDRLAEHNIKIDQFNINLMNRSPDGTPDNPSSGYADAQQANARNAARNTSTAPTLTGTTPSAGSTVSAGSSGALNFLI